MDSDKIKRLITEIYADQDEKEGVLISELPCHANQEAIVAYIEAEEKGEDPAALYPDVFVQLQSCQSCFTVYEELKELLEMGQHDTWIEPPLPAEFVLPPFMAEETDTRVVTTPVRTQASNHNKQGRASVKAPPPLPLAEQMAKDTIDTVSDTYTTCWHITALGELVATLSQEFLNRLSPQPPASYLKSTTDDLFIIQSPAIRDDLQVTISAQTLRHNHDECTLTVVADIPSRGGWPNLGGTVVTLRRAAEEIATTKTDAFGHASFTAISCHTLAELQLVVQPEP